MQSAQSGHAESLLERYEYKYLVPGELIPSIRHAVSIICRRDRNAREDGFYPIRSLYFDTRDRRLFKANEREARERFKVRVRSYPGTNAPVFLEVKARVGDVIIKSRASTSVDTWTQLIEHPECINEMVWSNGQKQHAERFLSLVHTYHLEPVVLVQYSREAYASELDLYARVTLDRRIGYQMREHLDLSAEEVRWRYVDNQIRTSTNRPVWVMELKFGRSTPIWMSALVRQFNLTRYQFSKYCYSLMEESYRPVARIPNVSFRRIGRRIAG